MTITIDEITFPLPTRIRGVVRLFPRALTNHVVALDRDKRHRWAPIAPCARVEVALTHPGLRWAGQGYLDSNYGDVPLEDDFSRWHWSRTTGRDATTVLYDVDHRDGHALALATRFGPSGNIEPLQPPPGVSLPRTAWRVSRSTRSDAGHPAAVLKTLEDTPFYARSLIRTRVAGADATAMHESLSLDRFSTNWVRCLLPFRMPRARR